MPKKRKAASSTVVVVEAPPTTVKVTPPEDEDEEAEEEEAPREKEEEEEDEEAVLARLRRRVKTTKEIESTVPGEEACVVEKLLPSFFDAYPGAARALERLKGLERTKLIRACDRVVRTGDESQMRTIVGAALDVEVIDVEHDAVPPAGYFQWQADGGDAGWLAYDDATNAHLERARVNGQPSCHLTMFGTPYTVDFSSLLQVNHHSSTVRPVRKIQK